MKKVFLLTLLIVLIMFTSCSTRQHEPIELIETPYVEEVVPAITFHVIDSTYSIGAIDLITNVDIDRIDKDIKYILYKESLATDTFCYHSSIKEMQYTVSDLEEYLIYMYEDNNPTAFKLK